MDNNPIIIYTVMEVAKILRVGKNKVYEYIDTGLLPAMKIGGLKITKTALEKFLLDYQSYDLDNPYDIKKLNIGVKKEDGASEK